MATGNRSVVTIESAGERAYERVRPLIEMAKRNLIELAVAVGKEYRGLPKGERERGLPLPKFGVRPACGEVQPQSGKQ